MDKNNNLTPADKMVWVALSLLIPGQDQQPIKRQHIANVADVSIRTVTTALKRLSAKEIISYSRPHKASYYIYELHKDIDESLLEFLYPSD